MTIDWANGKIQINSPHIQHLLKMIREKMVAFETISFKHIYRELNSEAEKLSKMALALPPNLMEVKEKCNDRIENQYVCIYMNFRTRAKMKKEMDVLLF